MKTNASDKALDYKCESPKTPGGISKSLLTPCRRVGLSRNWRKSGSSPFISPLAGEKSTNVPDKELSRKKISVSEDKVENIVNDNKITHEANSDIVATPSRTVQLRHRSKSKTSISSSSHENREITCVSPKDKDVEQMKENIVISKPVKSQSLRKGKKSPHHFNIKDTDVNVENVSETTQINIEINDGNEDLKNPNKSKDEIVSEVVSGNNSNSYSYSVKEKDKSPNNLTKECIVVIQQKINKNALKSKKVPESNTHRKTEITNVNPVSQVLFDSDSDETPLSKISKKVEIENLDSAYKKRPRQNSNEDNSEFTENVIVPKKIKKSADKIISIEGLTSTSVKNTALKLDKKKTSAVGKYGSQNSDVFDDDDFDFDKKRTILIRKTYDKVIKPQKAKSTGSVTQRDIDDLKARIEMKKNMILATAMTKDTEELRVLIKKWRKGCQDALFELMTLMKAKFPDKQYMDYSEILQMLKIPSSIVGYDSDNDSFVSPTDAAIILEKFN